MNPLRRWLLLAASVAALPMVLLEAAAQAYPSRPMTMIVPAVEQLTPQSLDAFQKAEIEKWWLIVKAAGIKAE